MSEELQAYWLSWYHNERRDGVFEYHGPWWITGWACGETGEWDVPTICAAMMATSAEHVMQQIRDAYDKEPGPIRMRFCEVIQRAEVFTDRFRKADWMQWPNPPSGRSREAA